MTVVFPLKEKQFLMLLIFLGSRTQTCNGLNQKPHPQAPFLTSSSSSSKRRRLLFQSVPTPALILETIGLMGAKESANASNLPASTGADTSKVGSVEKLIPIVRIRDSLGQIQSQIASKSASISFDKSIIPTTEMAFKRIFDEYSDPVSYKQKFLDQNAFLVYYTKGYDGPDRPNIEADINERQTQQFGLRNEIWISWDAFLVELKFIDDDDNDAAKCLEKTLQAINSYLSLVPPQDLKAANQQSLGDNVPW